MTAVAASPSLLLTRSDHTVNDYVTLLSDPVGSVDGLHVVCRVPGRVEQDHAVRTRKRDPRSTGTGAVFFF